MHYIERVAWAQDLTNIYASTGLSIYWDWQWQEITRWWFFLVDYLLPITGRTGVELWTGGWMAYVSERSEATVLSSIYLYFVELATPSMRLKSDAVSKHSSTAVVRVRFPMMYYLFMTIHTMMTTRLYYIFTTMHTMLATRLYHPRTHLVLWAVCLLNM